MTAKDSAIKVVMACGAVLTVIPIVSILGTVVVKGLPGIKGNIFTNDRSLSTTTDPLTSGGLLHAIVGTLLLVLGALILSVPIGILTALYLTEIRGRFSRPIRFLVQAMSGVPSIVAGLFILSAVVYTITKSTSGLMGSLALTILMIPTVARTSEEVLKLIPEDLREAGTALGGTQWRTVAMIVIPAAKSGSRPLCERLYGSGLFFTREEIQNISNQLGYSVFQLCGGWYTNPNTGRRTPFCRHEWKRNVVVEKTSR
jgi:phosphate transport system permease protein